MLPLISLIIPVYNVEPWLDACMDSVLAQHYRNLEIILVDDGAKDNSGAMCDRWAQRDPRVRVIHQENQGLSAARNTGLGAAEGDYVMFADSDDVLSPQLCSHLFHIIEDGDVAICDLLHIFPNAAPNYCTGTAVTHLSPVEAIQKMWYQTAFLPSACGKLYKRELFQHRRFTVGRLFEDVDLMHEIFYDAKKIVYSNARLYGYMHRENSITTHSFGKRELDILLIADKIADFCVDKPALQNAARAYGITAALRIYLNAPRNVDFSDAICQAKARIDTHGKQVLRDPDIRTKSRRALQLYFLCKPLLRFSYQFVNRWK